MGVSQDLRSSDFGVSGLGLWGVLTSGVPGGGGGGLKFVVLRTLLFQISDFGGIGLWGGAGCGKLSVWGVSGGLRFGGFMCGGLGT